VKKTAPPTVTVANLFSALIVVTTAIIAGIGFARIVANTNASALYERFQYQ
tara:strand:- start:159 stop:311 length:153 start_codon:yes stop_codon:yes gene_type:complete